MIGSVTSEATFHRPDLWLARHGETEWSRDGRHTSHTDLPLTANGEQAAGALAPRLADQSFDLVVSSPLRRARQTARLAGFADPVVDPEITEWEYGEYEGITTAQIHRSAPDWAIWTHGGPGGESPEQVAARVDTFIARVRAQASRRALVFAHGHILRVLAARWLEQPPAEGAHYRLDTGRLSILGWERQTPAIQMWNA